MDVGPRNPDFPPNELMRTIASRFPDWDIQLSHVTRSPMRLVLRMPGMRLTAGRRPLCHRIVLKLQETTPLEAG